MQAGDGTTLALTYNNSVMVQSFADTLTGVDVSQIVDTTAPTPSTGNSSTATNPSITTTTDGALVRRFVNVDGNASDLAYPTTGTQRGLATNNPPSNGQNVGVVDDIQATAGASGTKAWSHTSEEWVAATYAIRPSVGTVIDSDYGIGSNEFDYNDTSLDINGSGFGATQGTGAVYISDANTLAGSANEVDVSAAVTAWADAKITLDLTNLSGATYATLTETLGPGARYVIVTDNGASSEFPSAVQAAHRAKAIELSASTNIAASGENTTFQLTAPATKSTTDFGGGRIQDDENPGDTVDIGADEYREDEWSVEANLDSVYDETYQFRVLTNGTVIGTYTVDPRLTIEEVVAVLQTHQMII